MSCLKPSSLHPSLCSLVNGRFYCVLKKPQPLINKDSTKSTMPTYPHGNTQNTQRTLIYRIHENISQSRPMFEVMLILLYQGKQERPCKYSLALFFLLNNMACTKIYYHRTMQSGFLCVIAVAVRGIGYQLLNQSSYDVFYTYETTIIVHCQSKAKDNTHTTLRFVSSCDWFHWSDL